MSKYLKIKSPAEKHATDLKSDFGLENQGLKHLKRAYWNLPTEALYEEGSFGLAHEIFSELAATGSHGSAALIVSTISAEGTTSSSRHSSRYFWYRCTTS